MNQKAPHRERHCMRSLQTVEKALWEKPSQIERGGVYVALGFSGAQAEEKQFRPSGNRPENREIFRFPQLFSPSMKIHRFSWSVTKSFFDTQKPAVANATAGFRPLTNPCIQIQAQG